MSSCRTSSDPAQPAATGRLVVVSAPSGAGKTTLIAKAAERLPQLAVAVSVTTRPPRPGERDGVDYYFFTPERFDRCLADDAFVEWAEVHGNRYGTMKSEIDRHLARGRIVLFELDVQGMRSMRKLYPRMTSVFIAPPSLEELEHRLVLRGVNDADDMAVRLKNAAEEMRAQDEFDHVVVNDDLERATAQLTAIIQGR